MSKLEKKFWALMVLSALFILGNAVPLVTEAIAHSGSPSPTTWSNGQVLTHTALNDTVSHLHNTFSGGIVDAHLSTSAAVQHSKLQFPALVPKAWAVVTADCTGSAAAGTQCTTADLSRVSTITTNGATGVFRLNLAYTPGNTAFVVLVTSHTSGSYCMADTRATAAPHALIKCFDYSAAPAVALDANQFSVVVLDT